MPVGLKILVDEARALGHNLVRRRWVSGKPHHDNIWDQACGSAREAHLLEPEELVACIPNYKGERNAPHNNAQNADSLASITRWAMQQRPRQGATKSLWPTR